MQVLVGQNYGSYTFDAPTGVITLSDLPAPLAAGQLKLVINAATNVIIFNLADPTLTAVVSGSTIALTTSTTSMSNLDPLLIYMEVPIDPTVIVEFPSTQSVTSTQLPATLDGSGNLKVAVENTVPTNPQEQNSVSYFPSPFNYRPAGDVGPLNLDVDGHLVTRGVMSSDEGSFRDCFSGTSLTKELTGTVTFTNGGLTVTGVGTSFTSQVMGVEYDAVKLSTDSDFSFTGVYSVESDTSLTLAAPYAGSSGSGIADETRWVPTVSAGGSITVGSSNVNISNGVGNNALTGIMQVYSDYAPLVMEVYGSVSNSIANRTVVFGLQDTMEAMEAQVTIRFDGIINAGTFVTSISSSPDDTDFVLFSFPGISTYLDEHKYRISLANNRATLAIDDIIVTSSTLHLPAPYTNLSPVAYIQNNGTPAETTTLSLDFVYLADVDRIEIDSSFDESLRTSINGPNDTNNVAVTVTPYNALRIAPSSTQILLDTFSEGINTEDVWKLLAAQGGSVPSNAGYDNGNIFFSPGTTINGYSLFQTIDSFPQVAPGYLVNVWVMVIDPAVITGNYRYWGLGTTLATPNLTTPIIDGYGFEVGVDGVLYAVCYQGTAGTTTTRNIINNLSGVQPLDGGPHTYYTFSIGSEIYWSIDTKENVVASYKDPINAPHVLTLPLTALSISDGVEATLVAAGVVLGDDSHLGQQITDGVFAWRKATIKKASASAVSADTSLVVALHPNTPLPAGTNVIGVVDINSGQNISVTQGTTPWAVDGTITSKLQDGSGNAISSTSSALDVNIKSGGGSTQYASGTVQATPTGTVALGLNPTNTVKPLQLDSNGYLEVNVVGGITVTGGSFTSASDGPTGTAAPLDASFIGYKDGSGHIIGVGVATPLPIMGSITASDPSVGVVGASSPLDATQMGFNSGGELVVPSTTTPLPVSVISGSVSATVTGSVSQSGTWTTEVTGHAGATIDAPVGGSQPTNLLQVGGQTTTGAPTYVTGQQNPLSLTTSGGVRTDHSSVAGVALTAVPSLFGSTPTGSVQAINASLFAGSTSVPSGILGTSPGAATGTLPVNASLFVGTTSITTTGTAGQPLVGAIPYYSGAPIDPRQIRAITSSDQITVANFPSSQAVTGTFWPTTQPVSSTQLPAALDGSGNLKTTIQNSNLAVTGTFWQTTQPISGSVSLSGTPSVSVSNFPSSQAVTGTFWQATQPVSGSVSITGTPAISGTVTANQGTSSAGALWSVQVDNASAIAVADSAAETSLSTLAGAVTAATMQVNVTNVSTPAIAAGTNIIGNVVLTSADGTQSGVFAGGRLNVSAEASQLFVDTFDTFDTVNNWIAPTASGGGVTASVTLGSLSLATGTTTGGYSYLQSAANFPPAVPSYLTGQFIINLEFPIVTQTYRFWGFGTTPVTPTVTTPLTNACGFELYTDGKLYAVVYAGGVRTVIQDFSSATGNGKQPADANFHRYSMAWRSDRQFFMIDSSDAAATGNFTMPQVQTLPLKLLTIAGTSPLSSGVLTLASVGVGDSGSNNITISDAIYGFRGATVDASGNLHVLASSPDNTVLDSLSDSTAGPGNTYLTSGYQALSFQFAGVWDGSIVIQGSNDNSNWISLWSQNYTDGSNLDIITVNGVYSAICVTKYIRYNILSIQGGAVGVTVVGTQTYPDETLLLSQSFDSSTGVQMNTNVINLNKDINNSLIISDAPNPIYIGGSAGQTSILDTQGYQSLNVTTQTMVATVTCSNDKVTWSALSGTPLILGALTSSASAGAGFSFPCIARYIRFVVTTAGTATVFLRSTPWAGNYTTTGPTSSLTTNVATWAGTAGPSAGVAGVVAVGGNIAAGVLPTANPVLMAGIDTTLSATGTPAGLTRRLQTDTSGRLITASIDQANVARSLGSVSPNHNMQNTAALAIEDLSQFEGQTVPELLFQILIELKISNFYQYSLPALLTTGTTNSVGDEPSSLRNDPIATVFG